MKLVVMIPSYNEEETIASVIREIPRSIPGIETVEVLVINDGSTDRTVEEARKAGADKIISFKKNKGLAPGFRAGLETALSMGADIIVNTDADGQYDGGEIPKLIQPILDNKADFVLGSRTKGTIEEMPLQKTIGNRMATWVTRNVSGLPVSDGQSGFRAFTRDAAMRLNVMSDYTYVQETLIQAANLGLVYTEVPILFRKRTGGSSRLISNIFNYAKRAGVTILKSYRDYQPLRTFLFLGSVMIVAGFIVGLKPLLHYLSTYTVAFYGSAMVAMLLLIIGFTTIVLGLLADIMRTQKKVQDEILYRLKKLELNTINTNNNR
ncbi:glycosyl transferase family 2 [Methanoculleus taiwanensis]|uniref:Glycosyl transferase family 2 n=1 Tax=Methanoculleus taiwanensis TaxID=1550565 RepID=A0A498H0N9_9EURY|nr:glycosyltransferase family 2 protein [Methanoculleus taiwanensis]RXE55924.1 glycosyl transferase family 2 [Methanoculleus taiwanensis]